MHAISASFSSYLKGLLKDKQKFIVFAYHQVMLNSISASLEKLCVDYIRIDGSTRKELRSTYIDRFQSQDKCKVAVLSLKGISIFAHFPQFFKFLIKMSYVRSM